MGSIKYTLEQGEDLSKYRIGYSSNINATLEEITNWVIGVSEIDSPEDGDYVLYINKTGSSLYHKQFFTIKCNVCTIQYLTPYIKSDIESSGTVTISDVLLDDTVIGSTQEVSLILSNPITSGLYSDEGTRKLTTLGYGVEVYANGVKLNLNDTFSKNALLTRKITNQLTTANDNYTFLGFKVNITNLGYYQREALVKGKLIVTDLGGGGSTLGTEYLVYTSFLEYNGNIPTTKYFTSVTDLFNAIYIESSRVATIYESVKTDNTGGLVVGALVNKLNNTSFSGTCYMCYVNNEVFKVLKLVNSIITEINNLTIPTTISESSIIFPYFTKTPNQVSGWGYLSNVGDWWKHKLNLQADGQTLDYFFEDGSITTTDFVHNHGGFVYNCSRYFTINRIGGKIPGSPNNFKIPDIFRGSLVEIVIDVDVTCPKLTTESDNDYRIRMGNVHTEYNASFLIFIGK